MTVWRILLYGILGLFGCVLLLLLLLLLLPITMRITGDSPWRVRVRVLGIPLTLIPTKGSFLSSKNKPKKPGKPASSPAKKLSKPAQLKEELRTAFRQDGVVATAHYLQRLAELAGQSAGKLLQAVTVERLQLRILVVVQEDAAQTALLYSRLSGVVYPAVAILERFMRIRKRDVRVEPGFLQTRGQVTADVRLRAVPVRVLWAALWFVIRYAEINDQPIKEVNRNG